MTDDPGRRYWPESAIRHVECIAWSLWLPRSSRNLAPPPAVTASSRSARAMRSAVAGTDDPCMNLAPRRNSRSAQPASRPARPAAIAPTGVAALASPRRRVTQRRSGGRSPDLHRRLNRFPPPSPDRSASDRRWSSSTTAHYLPRWSARFSRAKLLGITAWMSPQQLREAPPARVV